MLHNWSSPHVSVLAGSDKNALRSIFASLSAELALINEKIESLQDEVEKLQKPYRR